MRRGRRGTAGTSPRRPGRPPRPGPRLIHRPRPGRQPTARTGPQGVPRLRRGRHLEERGPERGDGLRRAGTRQALRQLRARARPVPGPGPKPRHGDGQDRRAARRRVRGHHGAPTRHPPLPRDVGRSQPRHPQADPAARRPSGPGRGLPQRGTVEAGALLQRRPALSRRDSQRAAERRPPRQLSPREVPTLGTRRHAGAPARLHLRHDAGAARALPLLGDVQRHRQHHRRRRRRAHGRRRILSHDEFQPGGIDRRVVPLPHALRRLGVQPREPHRRPRLHQRGGPQRAAGGGEDYECGSIERGLPLSRLPGDRGRGRRGGALSAAGVRGRTLL